MPSPLLRVVPCLSTTGQSQTPDIAEEVHLGVISRHVRFTDKRALATDRGSYEFIKFLHTSNILA